MGRGGDASTDDRGPGPGAVALLRLAVVVLVVTVAVCALLGHDATTRRDGLSWFGVHARTVLPYATGLGAVAALQWAAADRLPDGERTEAVRRFLRVSALLVVGLLLTPYSAGAVVDALHRTFGATLFALQLLVATWFWLTCRGRVAGVLLVVQLVAGLAAAAALLGLQDDQLTAQVAYQLAFGAQLPVSVRAVMAPSPTPSTGPAERPA